MQHKIVSTVHQIDHIVYYCPSMEPVARKMLEQDDCKIFVRLGEIEWKKFEDGFPNLFIKGIESVRGRHCVFLADFLNLADIFHQLSIIYSLPRYFVRSLTVVLAYFPTGTMERVDEEGQIATAKTLATMLSTIPLTPSGPTRLLIYDIHALQERFYFGDHVVPILATAIPVFLHELALNHTNEQVAIAFPDEGAWKRFHNSFKDYELIICGKVRDGDKRIVSIKEGDCKGKHVFIVDDLVKTGGTLIQCAAAIRQAGAANVSAYVTHAVFPQDSWKRFTKLTGPDKFAKFYVTDSCPTVTKILQGVEPFHVISIAGSLVQQIIQYKM